MKKSFLLITGFLFFISGEAQPWFPEDGLVYQNDVLPGIDITVNPDSLNYLYDNVDSDQEFKARFVFSDGSITDTVENIGFRLRGNTSRDSDKKSFRISFNTFEKGRKYQGLEKMHLNGEHNDPSVMRSHLFWELCTDMRIPGSRSNHVKVYINTVYYGLYINVEHVDEQFIKARYENNDGNLYKCLYPADLTYRGGNKDDYKNNGYALMINEDKDDYSDLINLCDVLNNTEASLLPEKLESVFNVNNFLRYLAVEIFTGHWDGYSFNMNNYYLYHNLRTGKFEFIPYDVDNIFGIDWFGIDWGVRDIYNWYSDANQRPLTARLLSNQVYKDRFSFFMNELVTHYASPDSLFPIIDQIRVKIDQAAGDDPYRPLDYGWIYNDYVQSFTEALGAHVKYGLKPYVTARVNSIKNQLQVNPIAPIIENIYTNYPSVNQPVQIKADVTDDELKPVVDLVWKVNSGASQVSVMNNTGDNHYLAEVTGVIESSVFWYHIEATDASNHTTRDPLTGDYSITIGSSNVPLVINEFLATNSASVVDNYGQFEDWIEIKNNGAQTINLGGKYLSDDLLNHSKWKLPAKELAPGEYFIVWADDDTKQGDNHANFKLSKDGEAIGIFDSFENNYAPIDTVVFGTQESDISFGKNSDEVWEPQAFSTPGGDNGSNEVAYITFKYHMNRQILDGNFTNPGDFIDIAGTFNDWDGSAPVYDGDQDGILVATLFGFKSGDAIQFKARINGTWSTSEFPELGGDGNRKYTVKSGSNVIDVWYNDQMIDGNQMAESQPISIYPNPVINGYFTVNHIDSGDQINIYGLNGQLLKRIQPNSSEFTIETDFLSHGLYLVQIIHNERSVNTTKLLVK